TRGPRAPPQQVGKHRIALGKKLRAEAECRCVLPGGGREPCRAVPIPEQALWPSRARIHGTLLSLPPPIVRRIGPRQLEVAVIAIVADLVVHLAVAGEHAHESV